MMKKPTRKEQLAAMKVQLRLAPETIDIPMSGADVRKRCHAKNKSQWRCSRLLGHDGPHLATFGFKITDPSSVCAPTNHYRRKSQTKLFYSDNPWYT